MVDAAIAVLGQETTNQQLSSVFCRTFVDDDVTVEPMWLQNSFRLKLCPTDTDRPAYCT